MQEIYELSDRDRICRAFAFAAIQTWNELRDFDEIAEPSIMDYRPLHLKRMCPEEVKVIKFSNKKESLIGAYGEWWFGSGDEWFGMRVQAKKLDPRSLEYAHLDHVVKSSQERQVDLLIADAQARSLYAMYCFYNYWPVDDSSPRWPCGTFAPTSALWGSSVADAETIRNQVNAKTKKLQDVGRVSMPLMCLACCRGHARTDSPTLPHRARGIASILSSNLTNVPPIVSHLPPCVDQSQSMKSHNEEFLHAGSNLDGILIIQENPSIYAADGGKTRIQRQNKTLHTDTLRRRRSFLTLALPSPGKFSVVPMRGALT